MAVIADAVKIVAPAVLTSTAAQAVVQNTAGGNLILQIPGSNKLSGKAFYVQASGFAQSGPGTFTATVQPILYGDASLATVTTKPLFTSTAGTLAYTGTAAAGAQIPWNIAAEIVADGVNIFGGNAESQVGLTFKVPTVLVAPVSAINMATEPPIKFAIGNTGGGTVGTNFKFVVTEFNAWQE